jgi:succinate dehydrogenase / fumarate reductase cytochrome b subunit
MKSASQVPAKARPKYYDTNLRHLHAPGLLSILHRVSGAVMFLVFVPLLLIILQQMLRSESGFMQWKTALEHPPALGKIRAMLVKRAV